MVRIGDAWVSLERREIFNGAQPIRVGSRAFALLEALMAAPGRLVTKEELIQAVWPDTVVEENNLHVHVSTLRKTLGLDRRMLETLPGRGYRLNPIATEPHRSPGLAIDDASLTPPAPSEPVEPLPLSNPFSLGESSRLADMAGLSERQATAVAEQMMPLSAPADDKDRPATVHVIDDEPAVRAGLIRQLRSSGIDAVGYAGAEAFLQSCEFDRPGCLLLDVRLNQSSGFDLQAELTRRKAPYPIVFMTGFGTIDMSVRAMKAGAEEFLTKPFDEPKLLASVRQALAHARARFDEHRQCQSANARFMTLTSREQEVFDALLSGLSNKEIAVRLGLKDVTVKVHKKHIMAKLGTRTLAELLWMGKMAGKLPDFERSGIERPNRLPA